MKVLYRLAIRAYQQQISPHKGYRCAYSVTHGGPGCSGAVLSILEEDGLLRGWRLIKQRFHDCEGAAKDRRDRRKRDGKPGKSRCGVTNTLDTCMDVGDCFDGPCDGPCDISTSLKAIVSGVIKR
jgi:putative component of membrane protein insertase Oxa1/YidC/SpoIIIJ protein YidD